MLRTLMSCNASHAILWQIITEKSLLAMQGGCIAGCWNALMMCCKQGTLATFCSTCWELNPTSHEVYLLACCLFGRPHLLDHEHQRGPVSRLIVAMVQARNALQHCPCHDTQSAHTYIASASAVSDHCWVGPPRGFSVCPLLKSCC